MILEPQGCNSTKKKKKKDTSCNLNSQHCIQKRNRYNNREFQDRTWWLKGVDLQETCLRKNPEEILGKTN